MRLTRKVSPGRRTASLVAGISLSLGIAACGSNLDPDDMRGVSATTTDSGQEPTTDLGTDPVAGDDGPVVDADSGQAPDSDPGSVPGGSEVDQEAAGGADAPAADDLDGTGDDAADGGSQAGGCDGFATGTGVTDTEITLANASDISGPVPGIFESARLGARAYIAYFNSISDVCGRKIKLLELDTRADAGADQQAYATACSEAFAVVGSMSAFDSGGAKTAATCGLPDMRSTTVNPERVKCATCFAAQAVDPGLVPSAWPSFMVKTQKAATDSAALLYINAGAAPVNAAAFRAGYTKSGWNIKYFEGIDVSEFNFTSYVQQMKDEDIELVYYIGPFQNTVKLQQAMQQQGFEPDVYVQDSTIYDDDYLAQAGDLADDVFVYTNTALFDDTSNEEMQLYRAWLDQVSPGASPNFYGVFAWSAARLFLEKAVELGGDLTRAAMVAALKKVTNWTANDLHAPQDVGGKTTGKCHAVIQYAGNAWRKVSPGDYLCGSLVSTGSGS